MCSSTPFGGGGGFHLVRHAPLRYQTLYHSFARSPSLLQHAAKICKSLLAKKEEQERIRVASFQVGHYVESARKLDSSGTEIRGTELNLMKSMLGCLIPIL